MLYFKLKKIVTFLFNAAEIGSCSFQVEGILQGVAIGGYVFPS